MIYDSLCELGTPLLNKTQQITTVTVIKPDIRSKGDNIYLLLYQCPYRWGSSPGETCGRTGTGSWPWLVCRGRSRSPSPGRSSPGWSRALCEPRQTPAGCSWPCPVTTMSWNHWNNNTKQRQLNKPGACISYKVLLGKIDLHNFFVEKWFKNYGRSYCVYSHETMLEGENF